uniref:TM2 domain-containing protein n=1 Tax=Xiphophorus couchianus TaxID=32473 RepID=A0A3B5LS92_9TELE
MAPRPQDPEGNTPSRDGWLIMAAPFGRLLLLTLLLFCCGSGSGLKATEAEEAEDCRHLRLGQYPSIDESTQEPENCRHGVAFVDCLPAPNVTCRLSNGTEVRFSGDEVGFNRTVACRNVTGYSYKVAVALSLFLGWLGADRFYLGYPALDLWSLGRIGRGHLASADPRLPVPTFQTEPASACGGAAVRSRPRVRGGGAAQRPGPWADSTPGPLGSGPATQSRRAAHLRPAARPAGLRRGGPEAARLLHQRRPAADHQSHRRGDRGETRPGSGPEHGELPRHTRGTNSRAVPVQVRHRPSRVRGQRSGLEQMDPAGFPNRSGFSVNASSKLFHLFIYR